MDPQEQTALVPVTPSDSAVALASEVMLKGDLRRLSEPQKLMYITELCRSLGVNPMTRPFDLIVLNNREIAYPNRSCTDQLRATRKITIASQEAKQVGELFVVTVFGRDPDGREDSGMGAVPTANLHGETLANAMMKAETKAKRRMTLSLCGLGWPDESEIESIPTQTEETKAATSLAERVAAKAAALRAPEPAPAQPPVAQDAPAVEQVEGEIVEAPKAMPLAEFMRLKAEHGLQFGPEFTAVVERLFPGLPWSKLDDAQRWIVARDRGLVE